VTADGPERGEHVARVLEEHPEHARRQELGDYMPARLVRFGAVVRIAFGHALADAGTPLTVEHDHQEVFLGNPSEAGFEKVDERKAQQAQLEAIDPHSRR
jgi:hypothetical protein